MANTYFAVLMKKIKECKKEEKSRLYNHLKKIVSLNPEHHNKNNDKEDLYTDTICVHCKSENIVKNGKYKEKQRYICKDCHKTFTNYTNSPISYSKKNISKWIEYTKCMLAGYSLRKSSKLVGISLSTAFYWRHKILNSVKDFFEYESNIKNQESSIIDFKKIGLRYSSKFNDYFSDELFRCQGNSEKCLICKNINNIIKGFSSATFEKLKAIKMSLKLEENIKLCKSLKIIYTLKDHIKKWIRKFNGISFKYLCNYVSWFKWIFNMIFKINLAV